VLLIGDPRQVTYFTHFETKNKKYNGKIGDFIRDKCKKIPCEIDAESLNLTYRNMPAICSFSERLFPNYGSIKSCQTITTEHNGIYFVSGQYVDGYLKRFQAVQLRWDAHTRVNSEYPAYNMGESKGMEFDRVLIYPTKPITAWIKDNASELKPITRAKFYVAITRAKYSVAIVCDPNLQYNDSVQVWTSDSS